MNKQHDLWEDFLNLGERHMHDLPIPEFAYRLLTYTFKMMFDTAPDRDCVKKLNKAAMKAGYFWHLKDKNEDK